MYQSILISVEELWLKGKNRQQYVESLSKHISYIMKIYQQQKFQYTYENGRHVLFCDHGFNEDLAKNLTLIPGVQQVHLGKRVEKSLDQVYQVVLEDLKKITNPPKSFRVLTKRSDKTFPITSIEMDRKIGEKVLELFPQLTVDLHRPELKIQVRILDQFIYYYTKSLTAISGLPVGMNGRLVTLLSGGFDSPVASYLMSKRGTHQSFIFFHAYPFVGDEVKEKIKKLVLILSRHQKYSPLYIIPFGDIQTNIAKICRPSYRTLFFRTSMIECASLLANRIGAKGLVMGDSLGQVSSQTLENISLMDQATALPILRPLIGFNKREIISLAQTIGTHDTSVIPHDDACSLFSVKHPILRPERIYWENMQRELNLKEALEGCLEKSEFYLPDSQNFFVQDKAEKFQERYLDQRL